MTLEISMSETYTLQHIQLELTRLDLLLHRRMRQVQAAKAAQAEGGSPFDNFYVSDEQAFALLQQPFGELDGIDLEQEGVYETMIEDVDGQIFELADEAAADGESLRFLRLGELFGLSRFELDALLICVAPALDLRYEQLYGYLQNDLSSKRPSVNLILDLIAPMGVQRLMKMHVFSAESPLFHHRLLGRTDQPGDSLLNHTLHADTGIIAWLLGNYEPQPDIKKFVDYDAQPQPDVALLSEEQRDLLGQGVYADAVLVFEGRDAFGQRIGAQAVARMAGQPLLTLGMEKVVAAEMSPIDALKLMLRDAAISGAIPCVMGWDKLLVEDAPSAELLEPLCEFNGLVIIASEKKWQARQTKRQRDLFWIEFGVPDFAQRKHLLTHFLGNVPLAETPDLEGLMGQFAMTTGQLRDLVNSTRDMALRDETFVTNTHLYAAARAHSSAGLNKLAQKIKPRHTWEDLVVPPDQLAILQELYNTIRQRPLVLEQWGLGKKLTSSAGVTVMFAGPPGTGKTMAAGVLAGHLGLDIYKINLSSVVSKYIGETEKNLEKIFGEAESSNAIIFFDEADAIFGKRSEVKDAHDRYANVEVSYLLQRMEDYDGVTILATNLRANLDEAFLRRIQFALDFPFPEAEDRLRIWQALFPKNVPTAPDLNLKRLADSFRLAGGNIRNIIVSAAYLAASNGQVITMSHMLHGTRRELQKMGRLVDEESMEL